MNRILLPLLLALLLGPVLGWAAEPKADEANAIAEIEKLGGKVTRDEKSPDRRVISVDLSTRNVTDQWLACLQGLPQLQSLRLRITQVTDAGLIHVAGLTRLQLLDLAYTKITDPGLVHLEGLTELRSLNLSGHGTTSAPG